MSAPDPDVGAVRKALRYLKTVQGRPFPRTDDALAALDHLSARLQEAERERDGAIRWRNEIAEKAKTFEARAEAAERERNELRGELNDALGFGEAAEAREAALREVKEAASDSRNSNEYVGNLFRAVLANTAREEGGDVT